MAITLRAIKGAPLTHAEVDENFQSLVNAASPGGADTQVQYNNAGAFAGASGITTNGTELTVASGTKTASAPVLDMSQTWNNAAVTFTGLKLNVTDTASASASRLLDLQIGGTSYLTAFKDSTFRVNQINLSNSAGGTNYVASIGGGAVGCYIASGSSFSWSNSSTHVFGGTRDLLLTRRGAANLRFGAADAAAPVAQTLSVQSVVAGTTNTAGANLTITGSQGTGTGAGGSIIFQVAPAGSSGSAQNALSTALTIAGDRTTTFAEIATFSNGLTANSLSFNSGTGAWRLSGNNGLRVQYGGTSQHVTLDPNSQNISISGDIFLARDAAAVLALRNGTNAQTFRVYSTYTDASNYERGALNAGSDYIELAAETAGTGDDNLDVRLTPAGTGNVRFGTHSAIAAETVTGYITIKDSGGTTRKIAVVS